MTKPHPLNVPGPFYVEDGCCTACMAAVDESQGLLRYDEPVAHCHVLKQPSSADELTHMVRAASVADLQCLRYRGTDPSVLRRLAEAGLASLCDRPTTSIRPFVRNTVRFRRPGSRRDTAVSLRDALASTGYFRVRLARFWWSFDLHVAWADRYSANVRLRRRKDYDEAIIVPKTALGVQLQLADALASIGASDVEWRSDSQDELERGTPWPV
jgi:hypothetical protein